MASKKSKATAMVLDETLGPVVDRHKDGTIEREIRAPKANRDSRKAKATTPKAPKAAPIPADDAAAKAEAKAAAAEAKAAKAAADKATRTERSTAAHAEIARLVATESARRLCLCGCGTTTPRAFFVPGHDSKLLSKLIG